MEISDRLGCIIYPALVTLVKSPEHPIRMSMLGAMIWTFLAKGATGYTQQCEIWHEAYLGTLIMTQEVTIRLTMGGPCLGLKGQ